MKNNKLILLTAGRVSQMIIMFVTYRVLSSVLSVESMGIFYFLLSISAAFGLVFANPIGMYANRMLHSWQTSKTLNYNLKTLAGTLLIGSLLTIPILLLFKSKVALESQSLTFVISTLVFYVFSSSLNGSVIPGLNILGKAKAFVILTFLTSVIGLAVSYLLVKTYASEPLYWLIGQGIGFFVFAIVALLFFRDSSNINNIEHPVSKERIERVTTFALPIIITNIAVWTLGQSFRFFYKDAVDPVRLGELAFGLGLATSLCVAVEYLFHQVFFPKFYSRISDVREDKSKAWNELFNRIMPSYVAIAFFMLGLSPFIIRILADSKFKNSFYFLAVGAFVEILRMTGNLLTMATQSEMKTHKAIGPYLTGGMFTLISILIISHNPQWIDATPFILICGYLIAVILLWRSVGSLFTIHLQGKQLFKAAVISSPLLGAFFLKEFNINIISSIIITGLFGLYLSFMLYRFSLKVESDA